VKILYRNDKVDLELVNIETTKLTWNFEYAMIHVSGDKGFLLQKILVCIHVLLNISFVHGLKSNNLNFKINWSIDIMIVWF
jgi:hypothetical protein